MLRDPEGQTRLICLEALLPQWRKTPVYMNVLNMCFPNLPIFHLAVLCLVTDH